MLDDWEENLAMITANRTKDDELVLIHLGDCLWKETSNVSTTHYNPSKHTTVNLGGFWFAVMNLYVNGNGHGFQMIPKFTCINLIPFKQTYQNIIKSIPSK